MAGNSFHDSCHSGNGCAVANIARQDERMSMRINADQQPERREFHESDRLPDARCTAR